MASPLNAYIVECVRTASGRKNGALRDYLAPELGAAVLDELVERTGIDGGNIDEVICGCVDQVGQQAGNIGRMSVLSCSKIPESVPGTSVDRQCGSGQQAIAYAAQGVMSGINDCVIAMGVESMTNVPIGANIIYAFKAGASQQPSDSKGIQAKRPGIQFSQFRGAELLAKKHNLTREEIDRYAVESHRRAAAATTSGKFKREILPLKGLAKDGSEILHDKDEGIRPSTDYESISKLKPLAGDGIVTAATSSQIADGAAAIMVCNERGLKKLGLIPRARIIGLAGVGSDPEIMLEGPIPATEMIFKKTGMRIDQIDRYEVNEAFAPVPVAWAKAVGADMRKLNVNGGACALGHPLGCTGVKLMTTLVNELENSNTRFGLQAICEGGGTANATIIERTKTYKVPSNL